MKITIPSTEPKVQLRKLEDLKGNGTISSERPPLLNIKLHNICHT